MKQWSESQQGRSILRNSHNLAHPANIASTKQSRSPMSHLHQAPEEFICPLTLEVMRHPVMTIHGHNFEKDAILDWLQTNPVCPLTREPMKLSRLVSNESLRRKIAIWCQENSVDLLNEQTHGQEEEYCVFMSLAKEDMQKPNEKSSTRSRGMMRTLSFLRRKARSHH